MFSLRLYFRAPEIRIFAACSLSARAFKANEHGSDAQLFSQYLYQETLYESEDHLHRYSFIFLAPQCNTSYLIELKFSYYLTISESRTITKACDTWSQKSNSRNEPEPGRGEGGNQRELARLKNLKKQQEAKGKKGGEKGANSGQSLQERRHRDAERMREKQRKAEEVKQKPS
ncbi:hypothetical protein LSH36_79g01059 [Paralvinella palmiformis]|uniref:Small EDRK-rich factor-like N-terminal domain-containing protein n=1 Tax=Paralvinella palmiformis TaxID=53620 RepID=A0AAD9K1Y8_9ANNE|nr:hypothetical protein LSH36_79g01059 [Paralvinella palmiformis]